MKNQKTKEFYFICQAKGGVGKSMLMYLFALKNEGNKAAAFVDVDKSTRTSIKQLKFLQGENLYETNINDHNEKIDREKFFEIVEKLANEKYDTFFLDFGAPESEQLPKLFNLDFDSEALKEFEESLNAKFNFCVVIAGGGSYLASMEYLKDMNKVIGKNINLTAYYNENTFQSEPNKIALENLKEICQANEIEYKGFGNFYTDRSSGIQVLKNVSEGKSINEYNGFALKKTINTELQKL